ncbi:hypothetical protein V1264_011571 [Littorina saxatilis]|uniref:Uncharacterized protein n=1 Tax=Littorina saxatilis TaxID=31220 RepID=A0AAN9BU95_9CAEN
METQRARSNPFIKIDVVYGKLASFKTQDSHSQIRKAEAVQRIMMYLGGKNDLKNPDNSFPLVMVNTVRWAWQEALESATKQIPIESLVGLIDPGIKIRRNDGGVWFWGFRARLRFLRCPDFVLLVITKGRGVYVDLMPDCLC